MVYKQYISYLPYLWRSELISVFNAKEQSIFIEQQALIEKSWHFAVDVFHFSLNCERAR